MQRFILRRLVYAIPTLIGISIITFLIAHLSPGDPIRLYTFGDPNVTPADIERVVGLSEGNIFQGELTLQQMFFLRPAPAWARYRTPVRGLYQCGAGTHPGGGVMGASGRNAASVILRETR